MRKTLLLFTVLLFGLQGWATTFTVDGVTYTITDATNKTVAIGTGTGTWTAAISTSTVGVFTIPSSVNYNGNSYAVTAIGDYAFDGCEKITSVLIPTTITSIGRYAFYACFGLKSIVIPTSVKTLWPWAFYFSGLVSVSIPSTVTSISLGAFAETPALITVDSDNPNYSSRDGVLYNKTQTTLMQCPTSAAQVNIPNTVTSLDYYSFQDCGNLTSIIIPNTVTSIGGGAFMNCANLAAINIPGSVTSIDDYVFYGCSKLLSITVDSDNQNYSSLDGVLFNKDQTILLAYPGGKKNKSYTIPNSVTSIRTFAFEQTSLKEITIPSSVNSIGRCTFINTGLTSMYVSTQSLTANLGDNVFGYINVSKCNLYVPANSKASFAAADQWKDFVNIFEGDFTPSLSISTPTTSTYPNASVTFTATPTHGGTNPAYQWYLNGTAISGATKSTFTGATLSNNDEVSCVLTSSLSCATTPTATSNTITMKVSNFFTTGGICYFITSSSYPYTASVADDGSASYSGNVTIPSSVSYCGTTFKVTSIGAYAFMASKDLVSVTIPSTVTSVGYSAFRDCDKLTSIIVDAANPNYYSINGVLFNKTATNLVLCPNGKSDSYIIPSSVTSIADSAFVNCDKLTSIILPSSVTSIGNYAFMACSGIKSITLLPSIKSIGDDAFTNCTGLTSIHVSNAFPSAITLGVSLFYGVSGSDCTVYVPMGSKSLYEDIYPWNKFNIVEETDLFAVYATASSTVGVVGGSGSYLSGTTCIVSATANANYMFSNWTENGTVVSNDVTYTFTVNTARTLVANFIAGNTITAISNYSTRGSITGAGGYVTGASCTLTATANTGYIFSNWTENGKVASTKATFTFAVNAAHTFIANFVAGSIINATADASQGNITGTGGYATGSNCTLKATPKTGYVFTGWTENGAVVSTNPSYTFTVSAAHSLVANFSTIGVTVTQPTATTLSGSIVVTPSTGFTYSIDGKTFQNSNEFPYVSIGTYNVTLKNLSDGTVSSPVLAVINASGVVAANNYQIKASNCTCRDTKDGAIAITLAKALDYTVYITGTNTDYKTAIMFSGTSYNLKNLPADTYKLVFKIDFLDNYEQSFNIVVTQPDDLSVLKVGAEKSRATYTLSGGTSYHVSVNDNTIETQSDQVQVSLVPGENKIKIYTEKLCQGMYEETIYNSENGQISLFPNPTTGKITIGVPGEEESVTAEIISLSGAVELKQRLVVPSSRLVDIDVSDFSSGTYIVKVNGSTVNSSVKMMKK